MGVSRTGSQAARRWHRGQWCLLRLPRRGCVPYLQEEEPARAQVAELAIQGRHLLQEDRLLGVTHLPRQQRRSSRTPALGRVRGEGPERRGEHVASDTFGCSA
jgi:hypothetical protein